MTIQQSTPSIYQRAFPFYQDRIDLMQLSDDAGLGDQMLKHLLEGKPALPFTPSQANRTKIRHLFFESKNAEKIAGPNPLGVGFPLIFLAEGEELLLAPLFLWELQLEPALGSTSDWILREPSDASFQWNQFLLDLLSYRKGPEIVDHIKALAGSLPMSLPTLYRITRAVAGGFDMKDIPTSFELQPMPSLEALGGKEGSGQIIPAAILGLFPLQPTLPALDEETLRKQFSQDAPPEKKGNTHPFGSPGLLPAQASAFEAGMQQQTTLITEGTLRSQTDLLWYIISNALSNGERGLIVSDKAGTLLHLEEKCKEKGFGNLVFNLKNRQQDKVLLLELLKTLPERLEAAKYETPDALKLLIKRSLRNQEKLDASYRAVQQPIFSSHNWTELVGLFLRNNRIESKGLLGSQLQASEYAFDHQEYAALLRDMERSMPLYETVNTLKHPLAALHPSIFLQKTKSEGLHFVKEQIATLQEKLEKLHFQFIQLADTYAIRLNGFYENLYLSFSARTNHLYERISDLIAQYGEPFEKSSVQSLKWRGLVSGKAKEMVSEKEQLAVEYLNLIQQFQQNPLFEFAFPPTQEGKNLIKVRENINTFLETLQNWRNQLPTLVQDEVTRLSLKSANPALHLEETIGRLEQEMEAVLAEINESHLYEEQWEDKMLTVTKKQRLLEQFIERLETTSLNLRDFDLFFDWQRNWLSLPALSQKTFRALIKVKPDDWEAAFHSWYFHHYLHNQYSDKLPLSGDTLQELHQDLTALSPLLSDQIQALWSRKQQEAIKQLKRTNKALYQRIFGKTNLADTANRNLEELLRDGLDPITQAGPVLLMSYQLATSVLPFREGFFDYIIFLETTQLPFDQMGAIAQLGQRSYIFSAAGQEPAKNSLTRFLLKQGHQPFPLRGDLPLEDSASHWDFEARPVEKIQATRVFAVEGRYDEPSGTNEAESHQVIHLLNQIQPTPQRTYPTVGIVALTPEQRDLIATQLLVIKQTNATGSERIRQLERNGLLVVSPAELAGLHFQELIVSFTFSATSTTNEAPDPEGSPLSPEFIHALLLHPNRVSYWVHSFSATQLERWLSQTRQGGEKQLALYLEAVSAAKQGEKDQLQALATQLFPLPQVATPPSIFGEEVKIALSPYFDADRFLPPQVVGGIFAHLRIRSTAPNGPVWTILPDLFAARTPATSYRWEYEIREALKEANHVPLPVWSTQWWKNPRQEARILAGRIIQLDNTYQKKETETSPAPGKSFS